MKKDILKKALENVDKLPDSWFGDESASFDDLPSVIEKRGFVRTSSYIKADDLAYLKKMSKRTNVPVARLTGDIVSAFIQSEKKTNEET